MMCKAVLQSIKAKKYDEPIRTEDGQRIVGEINGELIYEPLYIIDGKIVTEEEGFASDSMEDWALTMGDNLTKEQYDKWCVWTALYDDDINELYEEEYFDWKQIC